MPKSRKEELVRILAELDTLYELGDDCVHPDTGKIVSDPEYDDMLAEFRKIDPKHPRFTRPSDSKVSSGVKKVKHDPPLTSISKASHEDLSKKEEMLFKWLSDVSEGVQGKVFTLKDKTYSGKEVTYPRDHLYMQYKLDGVALALYYEKGILKAVGTRPKDGVNGDDVTEQAKHVESIPQKLKEPITCSIRGELLCLFSDFEEVQKDLKAKGEKLRANPRNHTAGAIRNFKDPEKVKDMRLTFIGYCVENHAAPDYDTEIERAKYVNKDLGVRFVRTTPFNFYDLEKLEDKVSELDYAVDGVIVGVDNLETQEQLGRHGDSATGNPKGKIAWKFRSEETGVKVKKIDKATGRTGKLTPVACFDPVALSGTMVTRATLHNYGFVKEHGICVGTEITITKAGEIIPKVIGVKSGTGDPDIPTKCPSCGKPVSLEQSTSDPTKGDVFCRNDLCPAQQIGRLLHYLSKFGVLGLGEATVTQLVEGKKVKEYADFYKLDSKDVKSCGLSERQGLLAIANIHMIPAPEGTKDNADLAQMIVEAKKKKKKVLLSKLIGSFGAKNVGETTGRTLVDHFGNFDDIRFARLDELKAVAGVGDTIAESFYDFCRVCDPQITRVLEYVEPELPKTGKLSGKTFVLSGKVDKKILKKKIEDVGGKVGGSVSLKTTFLVAGDGSGEKSKKANKLGVPIISSADLEKML